MRRTRTKLQTAVTGNGYPATYTDDHQNSVVETEKFDEIESWRTRVESMRTKSRLCERGRIHDHLKSRSVLDRAIESLVSHTVPLYRPEARGEHGCFGEYPRKNRPASAVKRNSTNGKTETLSASFGKESSLISSSRPRTTVTTIKEFIYSEAGFLRPTYADEPATSSQLNNRGSFYDSKRSAKVLEREITDIIERRKVGGDNKKYGKTKLQTLTNDLGPDDDSGDNIDHGEVNQKKNLTGILSPGRTRIKKEHSHGLLKTAIKRNDAINNSSSDQSDEDILKSPTKVKFIDDNTIDENQEEKQPGFKIDWSKVNEVQEQVDEKQNEQKLLKTFAQIYRDTSFDEDDKEDVDREMTVYAASGLATLGELGEPEKPAHLRQE